MKEVRISGFEDYTITDTGKVFSHKKGTPHEMRLFKEKTGYLTVWLSSNGNVSKFSVHRLVAQNFLDNPENKPCVNHKNSVRDDNRLCNIEWATYSENNKHAKDFGFNPPVYGEDTSSASITNDKARQIYLDLLNGSRNVDVAKKHEVTPEMVANIKVKNIYMCALSDLPDIQKRKKRVTFSDATIRWICECLQQGYTSSKVVQESTNDRLKIHHVKDIRRGLTYKHISKDYKW